MTTLSEHFDTAAGSILSALGEPFTITLMGKTIETTGVFEELPEQTLDGVPILVRTPFVFFRSSDTDGHLYAKSATIKRHSTGKTYVITDVLRDASSSATYALEEKI